MSHQEDAIEHAVDPASNRLTRDQVIAIHRAHRAGTAWDAIAQEHNTDRKNVQRIVQGRRWRQLHPLSQPRLYHKMAEPDSETSEGFVLPPSPAGVAALRTYIQMSRDLGDDQAASKGERHLGDLRER